MVIFNTISKKVLKNQELLDQFSASFLLKELQHLVKFRGEIFLNSLCKPCLYFLHCTGMQWPLDCYFCKVATFRNETKVNHDIVFPSLLQKEITRFCNVQKCTCREEKHVPGDWADVSQIGPLLWQERVTHVSSLSASPTTAGTQSMKHWPIQIRQFY